MKHESWQVRAEAAEGIGKSSSLGGVSISYFGPGLSNEEPDELKVTTFEPSLIKTSPFSAILCTEFKELQANPSAFSLVNSRSSSMDRVGRSSSVWYKMEFAKLKTEAICTWARTSWLS